MAIDMSPFRQVFFDEAAEYLATAESLLLYLDPHGPDAEQIEDIHRAVHSIKGSSATFGLSAVADLAQRMQTLLDGARGGGTPLSEEGIAALVDACRILRRLLAARRDGGAEDAEGAALAGVRLNRIAEGRDAVVALPIEPAPLGREAAAIEARPKVSLGETASELRDLARKASAAAQDVVSLVRHAAGEDAALAREAEESVGDIMSSFGRLEGVVAGVAAGAIGSDAREMADAVRRLGDAIRQNEVRARKSAQSAELLRSRFDALAGAVARFALSGTTGRAAAHAAGAKGGRSPLPKFRRVAGGAEGEDEWPKF